mgnify:CR=1 FL=1
MKPEINYVITVTERNELKSAQVKLWIAIALGALNGLLGYWVGISSLC